MHLPSTLRKGRGCMVAIGNWRLCMKGAGGVGDAGRQEPERGDSCVPAVGLLCCGRPEAARCRQCVSYAEVSAIAMAMAVVDFKVAGGQLGAENNRRASAQTC